MRPMRWLRRMTALALLLAAALPAWAGKAVPFLSGRVVDEAAMVPANVKQRIEEKLAAFEQRTGNQVAVLTVDSLEGEPLEDYSVRVAQTWKLGQKGKDNGVLLLVAKQDRKMRIDVGYGLEPTLTDLETSRILDNAIRPDFQKGDFGAGIEHGVDAILTALDGGEVPAKPAQPEGKGTPAGFLLIFAVVIGAFSLIALVSRGVQSWFLYLFLMPFYGMVPSFTGLGIGPLGLVAWAVAFPILKLLLARSGMGRRFGSSPRRPWGGGGFWGGGGGFGGGGFGGGGGGGGFSGGGGSFGGGGASGSW